MDSSDVIFHDFIPAMAHKLGVEGLFQELAKGFQLLADPVTHTITVSSLRRNAAVLGLAFMSDDDLLEMIRLGDPTGHGELDLHRFCVAIVRSSPDLMEDALQLLFGAEEDDDDDDTAMAEDEETTEQEMADEQSENEKML